MTHYRAHLRVPISYAETVRSPAGEDGQQRFLDDVAHRLDWLGMRPVRLVMQDATDPSLLTAIGRIAERLEPSDGILRVERVEPVEDPPQPEPRVDAPDLDPGLNATEIRAVRWALASEANPRHLTGLAQTLEPWFPVAASKLRVRSALLEPGARFRELKPIAVTHEELDTARRVLEAAAKRAGIPPELMRADVKRAIVRLVLEPWLPNLMRSPAESAAALIVAPVVMRADPPRAGQQLEILRIADPDRLRRVLPPTPRDGFVSPTALQLAQATTGKPELSGVLYRELAPKRVRSIEDSRVLGRQDRIEIDLAKDALDRGERCLERCRWTRMYDRMFARPPVR